MRDNITNFAYLFSINIKDKKQLNLTSCHHMIRVYDKEYYPYSGLNIVKTYFNDSAANYISIQGIMHRQGIDIKTNLEGSDFKIYIYNFSTTQSKFYLHYYYNHYEVFDEKYFTLQLVPITHRLNRCLLKNYSKTCRAHFGDALCNIDIAHFKQDINIIAVHDNVISITHFMSSEYYAYGGYILINDNKQKYYIKSCSATHIEIDSDTSLNLKATDQLFAYMVCDKEFSTCCKKFDNAVNFRGEPFAPSYLNLLK